MTESESTPAKPKKKKGDELFLKDFESRTEKFNITYEYAGALCYFPFVPIFSYFWLQKEAKTNEFLRFNAIQSFVTCGIWLLVCVVLGTIKEIINLIPFVGPIIAILFLILQIMISVGYGIGSIKLGFTAKAGKKSKIPIVSKQVEEYMKKNPISESGDGDNSPKPEE